MSFANNYELTEECTCSFLLLLQTWLAERHPSWLTKAQTLPAQDFACPRHSLCRWCPLLHIFPIFCEGGVFVRLEGEGVFHCAAVH